jgi:hypothetical protein
VYTYVRAQVLGRCLRSAPPSTTLDLQRAVVAALGRLTSGLMAGRTPGNGVGIGGGGGTAQVVGI